MYKENTVQRLLHNKNVNSTFREEGTDLGYRLFHKLLKEYSHLGFKGVTSVIVNTF